MGSGSCGKQSEVAGSDCKSGIANACTGEEGMNYCEETAKTAARILNIDSKGVLVGSTGVIGMQLPIDRGR